MPRTILGHVLACLLVAGAAQAWAQGGSLPQVRRLPDGTLEVVKPPPVETPAPRPRPRPAPPAAESKPEPRDDEGPADEKVTIGKRSFRTVEAAIKAAKPGDTVLLPPIIYRRGIVVGASGITLKGQPGTHFVGGAIAGKAAMVVTGNDVTIESIGCADIYVADRNGACVRAEGRNLTLRNVEFRDSENGILTVSEPGDVRIYDSVFEGLGRNNRAHSIYVNGGRLHIVRSRFAAALVGHEIKSRAAETIVEDSVVTSRLAPDSRVVDAPDGGVLIMRRNVLHKGPNSTNDELIGVGLERRRHEPARIVLEDNIIIFERNGPVRMFYNAPWVQEAELRGNLIVGGGFGDMPGNRVMRDRASAGLPPFPDLPEAGRKP